MQTTNQNKLIGSGKYRNNTYQDVYENHYDYVKFLYSIKVSNPDLIAFVEYAKEQDNKPKVEEIKTEEVKIEQPSNNN